MRKVGVKAFILLVALLLLAVGCGQQDQAERQQDLKKPVTVTAVRNASIGKSVTVNATIKALTEVNVVPKLGGKVERVNVEVGDKVEKGQVLVELESKEIAAQVRQAEAALLAARSNLDNVTAGTRPEQLEQLRSAVNMAQAQYESARSNLERMRYLYNAGAISQQQMDSMETQYQVAEAQLVQAKENLRMAENGATKEMIQAAEAQVKQAEAALELAKVQFANTIITAPLDGVVGARLVDPGEMAAPTVPVVTVVQMDKVIAEGAVGESHVNLIAVGDEVQVQVPATGNNYTGTIVVRSPMADPRTKGYLVRVEIENKGHEIKPGMSAVIQADVNGKEVPVVPLEAVIERPDRKVVFIVEDGKAREIEVITGQESEQEVAILRGLAEGQQVVTSGQYALQDGDEVLIVDGGLHNEDI